MVYDILRIKFRFALLGVTFPSDDQLTYALELIQNIQTILQSKQIDESDIIFICKAILEVNILWNCFKSVDLKEQIGELVATFLLELQKNERKEDSFGEMQFLKSH